MSNFKLADNVSVLTDFTDGYTVYDARYALASHTHSAPDHGALSGLGDDDHTQYALLAGRSGGQTLIGGTASGDDLTLQSTNHATKGTIFFGAAGNSQYDEVNDRWGLGMAPGSPYAIKASEAILVQSSTNNSGFVARFTGASGSGVGPQNGFVTNDGSAMASADRIGAFLFNGYDGSAEVLGGAMIVQTSQAWSTTARGTKITFYTTPNSTTTLTAGLVVEQDGTATITNNANVGGEYRVDNTRVVTNRVTGWAAATGTASRATFATGTVTTAQLAQRVKALIDDLMTHGLIGT